MAPVIVAKDLYKCYPGFPPVLRGVNITVEPGEMVAVMGPSGCGKSTMLHVLGMLHAPDSGTLEVLGTDVFTLSREETAAFRRGNMGFVMQSSNLFEHSTVFENVEFPLIYERVPPEERWERVIRALELVHLSHRVNYRSNRLSGGEQQRVAIARAMVNAPRILLADEPTGALDARTSRVVMENFRTLAHEGRVAMVVVTHDPQVAEYCDSAYTLEEGALVPQHRRPVPPPGDAAGQSILRASPRRLDTACVVGHFPAPCATTTVQDVFNLHSRGVLARVYSLRGTSLSGLIGGDAQGLPVPMRRQSAWNLPLVLLGLVRRMRGHSGQFWRVWSSAPLGARLWRLPERLCAIAVGARMAGWCVDDGIRHVHALDAGGPALAAWLATRLNGLPFSFSVRGGEAQGLPRPQLARMAQDAVFVRCDTEHTRRFLQEQCGIPAEKCRLVRDPLPLPQPDGDIALPHMQRGQVCLLAVGVLRGRKGIRVLLKACRLLRRERVPFHLCLVGPIACWRRGLLRLGLWLRGLGRQVSLTGHVAHESMGVRFQEADIFINADLPDALHDGQWPAALGEAMLYGLPVVVSDVPAHTEIVNHASCGLVVPAGDAAALAAAVLQLARYPDKARAMGEAARARVLQCLETEANAHLLADALVQTTPAIPRT